MDINSLIKYINDIVYDIEFIPAFIMILSKI